MKKYEIFWRFRPLTSEIDFSKSFKYFLKIKKTPGGFSLKINLKKLLCIFVHSVFHNLMLNKNENNQFFPLFHFNIYRIIIIIIIIVYLKSASAVVEWFKSRDYM